MKILSAVASEHGATTEIGDEIGKAVDAVILGSAVYMGHWLDSART
jgi:menaquinone-dependent protoporphyrinogen IX oxidase